MKARGIDSVSLCSGPWPASQRGVRPVGDIELFQFRCQTRSSWRKISEFASVASPEKRLPLRSMAEPWSLGLVPRRLQTPGIVASDIRDPPINIITILKRRTASKQCLKKESKQCLKNES